MNKIVVLVIVLTQSFNIFSQTLTLTGNTDLQPIANATLYSKTTGAMVLTNSQGIADISNFALTDSILFSHVSFASKAYSFAEIAEHNFNIILHEKNFRINEMVVSANRSEEKITHIAQQAQVIGANELAFINQQTTADAMQNSGNILVQKSQLGGGSPIIRGFEANKVLMVVDGVRMNNAIYRAGHIQNSITLDNLAMDNIEILFGPGSVVYGSDALGGVMHFYTKTPELSENDTLRVHSNALTRYSTACSEKTGHVNFNLGGKKLASLTSISYSQFGDAMQGSNRNPSCGDWGKRTFYAERINGTDTMMINTNPDKQLQSGYTQYDVLQKLLFCQSKNVTHALNFQFSNSSNIPRYDRLTETNGNYPKFAQWYYGPQKRLFASYTINLKTPNVLYNNSRLIIGYQNVVESRHDRKFNKTGLNNRTEKLDIFTLNADLTKKLNRNEIRYGVDAWYNKVNSSANTNDIVSGEKSPLNTRYPSGGSTMQSLAAYITHTFELNEQLIINDGIRLNNVQLNSTFTDTTFFPFPITEVNQNNNALNGNLGVVYMPGSEWRLTAMGSSGFRAPNVDDLSKVFDSQPGSVIVPNPNLKPEYTYNVDAGLSKTIKSAVTLALNGYYTWYKQAITTQNGTFNGNDSILYNGQLSGVTMNVNASEAYIYGLSAFLSANVTRNVALTSTLNYTYGRIKTDTVDYPLDHIAPVFGKTSILLKLNQFKGEFFMVYSAAKKSADYNLLGEDNAAYSADAENGYMPAWLTLNLRIAYQLNKHVQLQVALENILDRNYRVFASGIGAPGRNFEVSLRGMF